MAQCGQNDVFHDAVFAGLFAFWETVQDRVEELEQEISRTPENMERHRVGFSRLADLANDLLVAPLSIDHPNNARWEGHRRNVDRILRQVKKVNQALRPRLLWKNRRAAGAFERAMREASPLRNATTRTLNNLFPAAGK